LFKKGTYSSERREKKRVVQHDNGSLEKFTKGSLGRKSKHRREKARKLYLGEKKHRTSVLTGEKVVGGGGGGPGRFCFIFCAGKDDWLQQSLGGVTRKIGSV